MKRMEIQVVSGKPLVSEVESGTSESSIQEVTTRDSTSPSAKMPKMEEMAEDQ